MVRRALAGTHAGLGGLLRHGFVREDSDPVLPATAGIPSDHAPRGLDLVAGDPRVVRGDQPVLAERDRRATVRLALAAATMHAAEFRSFRLQQHATNPLP